jgi:hypothetical protein
MPFWMPGHSGFDRFLLLEQRISRVDDEEPFASNLAGDAFEILRRIMHGVFVSSAQELTAGILMQADLD